MTGNPWFRILQPRPNARQRLLIVPHAGGGPAYYRDWTTRLPDWIEVAVVQLPGRASRWKEPAFSHMAPLLEQLAPQLIELLNKPLTLFGHSLGALIAFELSKRWCAENRDVRGLIVSGAAGPNHPRTKSPLYSLTDQALRNELAQLGGTPTEVQDNDELFLLFLPTLRADLEVLETYQPLTDHRLSFPLMVCGGNADGWSNVDQLLDWTETTTGPVHLRIYPGGHFFVLTQRERLLSDVQQFISAGQPTPTNIELWRLNLDQLGDLQVLSEVERSRADRFIKQEIRDRFVSSRSQMRNILGSILAVEPKTLALKTTDFGKPFLDPACHGSDLRFNLSHSDNVGLLAVTRGHEIGVDVEQIRPQIATGDLAGRYFSPQEVADLEKLPESARPRRFFDYWSAKEAYIKARGRGLNIPLNEFDIPLDNSPGPFVVLDHHEPAESGKWQVLPVRVNNDFAASVCSIGNVHGVGVKCLMSAD